MELLDPIFMSFVRNAQSVRALVLPMTLFLLVFQTDLSPITVLLVFSVDAVQLQLSRCLSEPHIDPPMRETFSKIVTDCWLVNEMQMSPSIMASRDVSSSDSDHS